MQNAKTENIWLPSQTTVPSDSSQSPPPIAEQHNGENAGQNRGRPDSGSFLLAAEQHETTDQQRQAESGLLGQHGASSSSQRGHQPRAARRRGVPANEEQAEEHQGC